jgi:hypothetical protein
MNASKQCFVKWSEITQENFETFLKEYHNGFAILTGGKYIVIDFDSKHNPPQEILICLMEQCKAVEQTPGGYHFWFLTDARTSHFSSTTDAYWNNKSIKGLDIRSKGGIIYCAPSRYTLLDGTHKQYEWIQGNISTATVMPSTVLEHLHYDEPQNDTGESNLEEDDIIILLDNLSESRADIYGDWISVGMALKNAGYPCEIWDEWSKKSAKYKPGKCTRKWTTFKQKGNSLSLGSLYQWLKEDNYNVFISLQEKNKHAKTVGAIDSSSEIYPRVKLRDYLTKKGAFEQQYFYYVEKNAIAEIQEDKSLKFYTLPHAEVYLNSWDFIHGAFTDRTSFLHLWLKDPERKVVKTITIKPSEDPFTYVQPISFAYKTVVEPRDDSEYLQIWNTLVTAVSGGEPEKRSYLEKWLAHCIQKPFDLQGTALVVTGDKGVGKDTLFDFFSVYVLGEIYCQNYTNTQQFWDKHDTGRMNKLFVKLEEAVGALNRQNDSAFKARITSMHQTFNPKGIGAFTCENFNRYVLTTNESNPVRIEDNDRRFVLMVASRDLQGNHAFWNEVREKLFTAEGGAAVGAYLAELDLKGFNPRILPADEYKEAIANAEKTSEQRFIESWDGTETGATELYRLYVQFCAENQLPYCNSAKSFGMRLLVFIRDKRIFKRRDRTDGMSYSKTP